MLTQQPLLFQVKCGRQPTAGMVCTREASVALPSWETGAALSPCDSMLLMVNCEEIKQDYECSVPMAARPIAHSQSMLPHEIKRPLLPPWRKKDMEADSELWVCSPKF